MNLLVLLDFDGVIFNSAYEAYQVCEHLAKTNSGLRKAIHFDEFMDFRRYVTNAWQFNRLYSKKLNIKDFAKLPQIKIAVEDEEFARAFFIARQEIMKDPEWAKLMSPYPFFYELKKLISLAPAIFKILSTRDEISIKRTLDFFSTPEIEIYGQESLKKYDSKLALALDKDWMGADVFTVYVDDMNYHLEPFQGQVNFCVHAGWGYDFSSYESYTQSQVFNMINGLVSLARNKKND